MIFEPSRSSVTGTIPLPVSRLITSSWSGPPSTNAAPSVGCPANCVSAVGVKMRIFACPPASAGYTNTVSENLVSSASRWSISSGISRASVKTASWFPSSGRSVNTSAMT